MVKATVKPTKNKATKVGVQDKTVTTKFKTETEILEKREQEIAEENASDNGASQNDEISSNKGSRKNI